SRTAGGGAAGRRALGPGLPRGTWIEPGPGPPLGGAFAPGAGEDVPVVGSAFPVPAGAGLRGRGGAALGGRGGLLGGAGTRRPRLLALRGGARPAGDPPLSRARCPPHGPDRPLPAGPAGAPGPAVPGVEWGGRPRAERGPQAHLPRPGGAEPGL